MTCGVDWQGHTCTLKEGVKSHVEMEPEGIMIRHSEDGRLFWPWNSDGSVDASPAQAFTLGQAHAWSWQADEHRCTETDFMGGFECTCGEYWVTHVGGVGLPVQGCATRLKLLADSAAAWERIASDAPVVL